MIRASSESIEGRLTILRKDPHALRVDILYIIFTGCVLVAVFMVSASGLSIPRVQTISGASTVLSSYAQVGATFAGFLIVGLIFLIQLKSKKEWVPENQSLRLIRFFDLIFLGLATVVFSLMALTATDSLGYVASRTQVDNKTVDFVRQTAVLLRLGMVSATVGFSVLVANFWDRWKEIRHG